MTRRLALVVVLVAGVALGCSDDTSSSTGEAEAGAATTTTAAAPPQADLDLTQVQLRPIDEGAGAIQSGAEELPDDYVESEHLLSGVATTYRGAPNEPATPTGQELEYTTRLIVRAPEDPEAFSGRVFVEPFNTSGGPDADVVWRMVWPVFAESGDVWVGVTVRHNSGLLMQDVDPERYAAVDVPVNDVGWDILRQVGGLLKEGAEQSPYPEAPAEHVYLGGYSQSGLDTASFLGAIAGDTRMADGSPIYDGFLPAARSASLTSLRSGTDFIPRLIWEPMGPADVPVVDLESQSDVMGFSAPALEGVVVTSPGGVEVRKEDSDDPDDLYRLYEVAGMPHGSGGGGTACEGPPSEFPNRYFVRAAVELLFRWAEEGEAPPEADRIEMASNQGEVWTPAVDEAGNAVGGVRSPWVDVPLVRYEAQTDPGAVCKLRGRQVPLDDATLAERYESADDYLAQFTASLDETIEAGFIREADRDELIAMAEEAATRLLPA